MDTKPIVEYLGDAEFFDYAGNPDSPVARVYALNHPIWGNDVVRTSLILKLEDNGDFETRNTRYRKTG